MSIVRSVWLGMVCFAMSAGVAESTINVFVLAGDECVLEQGAVAGRTDGVHEDFYPNAEPTKGENRKHVQATVYAVAYAPGIDFDALATVATADAGSDAKAADYEGHLANLIRDLRKDLHAPGLPFVVGALAEVGGISHSRRQQIFDAQMAVGNPAQYPEFAGNVISIDTRPMCQPPSECPGGRDPYKGHAASYLEIGTAMAEAILQLQTK